LNGWRDTAPQFVIVAISVTVLAAGLTEMAAAAARRDNQQSQKSGLKRALFAALAPMLS
jgi:hypothetical protein